jgi:hypothetical protein
MFAHLKKCQNSEMVFDPIDPVINESDFELQDWTSSEFGHVQGREENSSNMPGPRGLGIVAHAKVDTDHISDITT